MPEIDQKPEYVNGDIEGVVIRPLRQFNDNRGWLVEIFRHDELVQDRWPTMMYVSSTLPGVARSPRACRSDGWVRVHRSLRLSVVLVGRSAG